MVKGLSAGVMHLSMALPSDLGKMLLSLNQS